MSAIARDYRCPYCRSSRPPAPRKVRGTATAIVEILTFLVVFFGVGGAAAQVALLGGELWPAALTVVGSVGFALLMMWLFGGAARRTVRECPECRQRLPA